MAHISAGCAAAENQCIEMMGHAGEQLTSAAKVTTGAKAHLPNAHAALEGPLFHGVPTIVIFWQSLKSCTLPHYM